jgi:hypothetical protein
MQLSTPTTRLIASTRRDRQITPGRSRFRVGSARLPLGAALVTIGSVVAIIGGALLALLGTNGRLASGARTLSTPTSAMVSPVSGIQDAIGVAQGMGTPTLRISASPLPGSPATFVGIARAADVDRYLARVSGKQTSDLGFRLYAIRATGREGSGLAQPPTAQRFWVAEATSTRTAKVNWRITNDRYRVVIMNANGQNGFATTTTIATTQPNEPVYALVALIAGLLMTGGGTILLIRTTGRSGRRADGLARLPNASPATTA